MSAAPQAQQPTKKKMQQSVERWGAAAIENGWTLFPNTLLKYQSRLRITPQELCVILQILKHWWDAHQLPFPSQESIAECIGCDKSTVQRTLKKLRDKKLVSTESRFDGRKAQRSNFYSFEGLIAAVTKLAEEDLAKKQKQKEEDADRRRPKPKYGHGLKIAK